MAIAFSFEPAQNAYVLLYPEGMIKLNDSASIIVAWQSHSRCAFDTKSLTGRQSSRSSANTIAKSMDPGMETIAEERGWTYVIQADNSCRVDSLASADVTADNASQLVKCQARTPGLRKDLLELWHPDVVVMASFMQQQNLKGANGEWIDRGSDAALRMSEASLGAVAREVTASGAWFILVELPPRLSLNCANAWRFDDPGCTFAFTGFGDGYQGKYDAMYERLAASIPRVSTLSLTNVVCPDGTCRPVVEGTILRWDGLHFTAQGAGLLAPVLALAIQETGAVGSLR